MIHLSQKVRQSQLKNRAASAGTSRLHTTSNGDNATGIRSCHIILFPIFCVLTSALARLSLPSLLCCTALWEFPTMLSA